MNDDWSLTLQPDDIGLIAWANETLWETNVTGGAWTPTEVAGWNAEIQSTPTLPQAEFNITYSKIAVMAGVEKTIGAAFMSTRAATINYTWPPGWSCPSQWGGITSTGYNWIAEFPSFLILPLFMIATLTAVIVYRRKHPM